MPWCNWSRYCLQGMIFEKYSNGDIFDGNWANGKQDGDGVLLYASGNRLEGLLHYDYNLVPFFRKRAIKEYVFK